jgi:hypothetical protein
VDLLFGGILSRSTSSEVMCARCHRMSADERARITREGLRVGGLRSSGARPEPEDPTAVDVPLRSL